MDSTQVENYQFGRYDEECSDTIGNRDGDNLFKVELTTRTWEPLTGSVGAEQLSNYKYYKNFLPAWAYSSESHNPGPLSSIPSVGTVALATLARSNPSRPAVSIPNFIYELKDLPKMIRDIGNFKRQLANIRAKGVQQVTPKNAASHLLSYQMGWRPLISDLRKLLSFQADVNKKYIELQNLYNKGGIQRRVRNPSWTATQTLEGNVTIESGLGDLIRCRRTGSTTVERWGTVRWKPSSLPKGGTSDQALAKLARDLTFGMNGISAKQLWDAIPWTWLIGWFSNCDEFFQAHFNTIPLSHSTPCVMTKRVTRADYTRLPGNHPQYTGGNGTVIFSTKERTVNGGSLSATIPFLNGRQLSILGALAIQRKR